MHWTSDRFLKNCSINIKIAQLTSKSLILLLCSGSGYLHFARWINQCQFGYKMSSVHRISYFTNTKCKFGAMPELLIDFSKITQLRLKLLI